ncbi:EAL domain-containing protein [Allofranklinella schreckenbergeri]|uniref:EAL domain-containing protein n=1 Tax=Allofranklinella schreckenbergeri TaxID=1076744 RepID=A0A3M6QWU7_9BURK|nr:EAL domain-containing protein [Allofranklinella schreckenbergeri]RMX07500.1 EAL domain-containing protein [Allofranklinella schreckenbergeri]
MSDSSPQPQVHAGDFPPSRFWIYALPIFALMVSAAVLLWRTDAAERQALARQQLQTHALQYLHALQKSANAYARFLRGLQSSLDNQDASGASLGEQWSAAMQNQDLASSHVLRLVPASQASALGLPVRRLLEDGRSSNVEVQAIAQPSKLTLVAIPAHGTPQVLPESMVMLMDLRFTEWLHEIERQLPFPLSAHLRPSHAAQYPQPVLEWEQDELHLSAQVVGQPLHLVFAANNLTPPPPPLLPWSLFGAGLLGMLLCLIHHRWRELQLAYHLTRYQDYAYKGWQRYFAFINHPQLAAAETDHSGQFYNLSPRLAQMLGYGQDAMKRLTLRAIVHPDDLPKLDACQPLPSPNAEYLYEQQPNLRLLHSLGHFVWVDLLKIRYTSEPETTSPTPRELLILRDQTHARTLQARLQRRIEKSQSIFEQLPVGMCTVDTQMRITFMNANFRCFSEVREPAPETLDQWWQSLPLSPRQREDLIERWQQLLSAAIASDGILEPQEILFDIPKPRRSQRQKVLALSGIVQEDQLVLTLVDLTEHKKAEDEIRLHAFYDPGTNLPNRHLLLDRLQQAQQINPGQPCCNALMLISLENLAALSATLESSVAQELVRQVAARLTQIVPSGQTIARTQAAEFTVLLAHCGREEEECVRMSEDLGRQILDALSAPFGQGGHIRLQACIGVTIFRSAQHSSSELLRRVDIAAFQAHQGQLSQPQFYEPQLQARAQARAALEEEIRAGLALGQFMLYFQPQMDGRSDPARLIGAEVLLRWNHAEQGVIAPGKFLPIAECSELIIPLGNWVLAQACRQLLKWSRRPETAQLSLSVNISPRQFRQKQFAQTVLQALTSSGAPASRLILEISESVLLTDIERSSATITQLHAYGVRFALDDFGVGHSWLSQLESLPLSSIKFDARFINHTPQASPANKPDNNHAITTPPPPPPASPPPRPNILRSAVALGSSLGLQVVAEGVENQTQIDFLKAHGCYIWQGYYTGVPQPLEEFEQLIQAHHRGLTSN